MADEVSARAVEEGVVGKKRVHSSHAESLGTIMYPPPGDNGGMRAMRLERVAPPEERPLALRETPAPEPDVGEVLIEVEACGVCRTDLHILEGEVSARLPVTPGHQAAGRIVRAGAGVAGLAPGDSVGVGWIASTCGVCRFCRTQRENLCERGTFTGRDRDGGYAERMT